MWGWLSRNAGPVEALAALVTALVALAALIGVKMQIDASERIQREQAARDIYRGFLALSIQYPEFSTFDYCDAEPDERTAYEAYVEYLLYAAEQAIAVDPAFFPPFTEHLTPHRIYICNRNDWTGYAPQVERLIGKAKVSLCEGSPAC